MRMTLPALGLLLSLSLPALAQDPAPLDLSKVPQEGKAPQDFVPSGWKLEDTVRGDLDKNGSEDVVLQLVEAGSGSDSEGQAAEHARALLVLLTDGAKLRRAGASHRILYCSTCAGTLSAPGAVGQVKLQKGVLLVDQVSGSREMTHTLLRFRFEPKDKRFLLIGEDVEHADRALGSTDKVSTNLLTGQRISEKLQFDEKKDKDVTLSSKKEKVPVKKVFLEDVDISTY
jgi:hypothetical protein